MSDSSWLEVSLTVDGELAEAVAELMRRYIPDGIAIESTTIIPDPEGEGKPGGPLRVCGYLPIDDRLEETRRRLEEGLWHLGRIRPLPEAVYKPIQEINWVEAWKQHYQPIPVGRRLVIIPAWLETATSGRIPIRIEPGMAFGTGTHPTTQLCLELLEENLRPGEPVIDVGCGSGILSIAAIRLGASRALGVDIDAQAIPNADENAAINGIADLLEIGVGSVGEVLAGKFSMRQAPVVTANLLSPILVRLLEDGLADVVAPGGRLILSGILEEQWQEASVPSPLREALHEKNLDVLEVRRSGDWIAALAGKKQQAPG
jgi:ribosomal protein L11 methyltransferase